MGVGVYKVEMSQHPKGGGQGAEGGGEGVGSGLLRGRKEIQKNVQKAQAVFHFRVKLKKVA